jgi:hypothetical protein
MNSNRTNMTNIEQPTTREQPSYFNARESIIPRLPDTPLKQEVQPPKEKDRQNHHHHHHHHPKE